MTETVSYPADVLEGCESALVLFAAAFGGRNDAVYIADAGLTATCVDTDLVKLTEMKAVYPPDWRFVTADAFRFARDNAAVPFPQWDIVSLDPFTNLFDRCAQELPLWTTLARKAVILGSDDRTLDVPDGWRETERRRRSSFNGGVYWAVLERAA